MIRLIKLSTLSFVDYTWDAASALVWSTVEADVGVLCANIPVMGPLLPRTWRERNSGSRYDPSTDGRNLGYSRTSASTRFSYLRRKDGTDHEWQDDGQELVHRNPLSIKRTTEISVLAESRREAAIQDPLPSVYGLAR